MEEEKTRLRCILDYFKDECFRIAREREKWAQIKHHVDYRVKICEVREEVVDEIYTTIGIRTFGTDSTLTSILTATCAGAT
jgi:hypothetical protein